MIKPTVGRVVWYHPNEHDSVLHDGDPMPMAAIVAYVHGDRMVNLMVIDRNGFPHSRTSVDLMQDDPLPGNPSYCEWMPFQKGQAKAQEQAK